mgnify:CR=1 FL=1
MTLFGTLEESIPNMVAELSRLSKHKEQESKQIHRNLLKLKHTMSYVKNKEAFHTISYEATQNILGATLPDNMVEKHNRGLLKLRNNSRLYIREEFPDSDADTWPLYFVRPELNERRLHFLLGFIDEGGGDHLVVGCTPAPRPHGRGRPSRNWPCAACGPCPPGLPAGPCGPRPPEPPIGPCGPAMPAMPALPGGPGGPGGPAGPVGPAPPGRGGTEEAPPWIWV